MGIKIIGGRTGLLGAGVDTFGVAFITVSLRVA